MPRRSALVLVAFAVVLSGCGSVALPSTPADGAPTNGTSTVVDDPGVPADGERIRVTVVDVVDGDTIDVRYQNGTTDTVRLVGIDTPETYGETNPAEFEGVPDTQAGHACLADVGERATVRLSSWIGGENVTLVVDPQTDRRGYYGRLLAYVASSDTNHNYRLVARGYARVYDTEFTRADAFYAAESRAMRADRGVWQCTDPATRLVTNGLRVRVVADAPGNDHENLNGEFVVIENADGDARPVGDWSVSDAAGHRYVFPADAAIPANESVRLYTGSGTGNATAYYWGADGAVWNNGGDTVTIRNDTGAVVVEHSY